MSDLLLILGLVLIIVAAFLFSVIAGLLLLGVGMLVVSLALSDGKGLTLWRS
ncbi:hypothetical protein ACSMXN_09300 [Jatrophihabitans sp. DSM 45814]